MIREQRNPILIPDNTAIAFLIKELTNSKNYLLVDTTNSAEKMDFGNADTNPAYNFLGSGAVVVGGSRIKWSAGTLELMTDEGTNTSSYVYIKGKGTGIGYVRAFDEGDDTYCQIRSSGNVGYIETGGTGASSLVFQNDAQSSCEFFSGAASGETRELVIKGFRAGDALRSLQVGVGVDAADTASFDGLSNYLFDGAIQNPKAKMTAIGGFAILLTNTTGAVTVKGQTVKPDTATDDAVILTAADDDACIGVFLDAGVADDAEAWVVVSGIADVLMGDNEAATRGNWVETNSTEAGYADATAASPAAAPQHFNEIGHCIESVSATGAGTHILARCVLHFN
jgi:hypothetical protein